MINFIEKAKAKIRNSNKTLAIVKNERKSKISLIIGLTTIIAAILIAAIFMVSNKTIKTRFFTDDQETLRAMEYDVILPRNQDAEAATNCDFVKFDAFFLRDIDGDGYAEQVRGSCKEIGSRDVIYINFSVNANGIFKDGKITINNQNFYLQTAMPKDNEIKKTAAGTNIKEILLNDIQNGTQKLLMGSILSGDYTSDNTKASAIGNNINNLSRINSITLTGTHVADDGTETQVEKTVEFWVDWYGDVTAAIPQFKMYSNYDFKNQESLLHKGDDDVTFDFTVLTAETQKKLLLEKAILEMDVPQLNGYDPISVTAEADDVTITYDEVNRKLRIEKTAETNAVGNVIKNAYDTVEKYIRYNEYTIKVVYPLEAYLSLNEEDFRIDFPVYAQYEGYNNPNDEFENPKKSNIATDTVSIFVKNEIPEPPGEDARPNLNVTIGKKVYDPDRYVVEKKKLLDKYSGIITEDETPDRYTVKWQAFTGTHDNDKTLIIKPKGYDQFVKSDATYIDMGDFVTVKGVYLQGAEKMVGPDGYISIFDDDTDKLLHTFTAEDWNTYRQTRPFMFDSQTVKNIRVETSATTIEENNLYVYMIKEIDDDYVLDNISISDFQKINFIHTEAEMYYLEDKIDQDYARANFEASTSLAEIRVSPSAISNQATEEHQKIYIETVSNDINGREKWTDGTFLVKMPDEIIALNINDVTVNNNAIQIESYEVIEDETGMYIQVLTKASAPTVYTITVDVDTTADPRMPTIHRDVTLYYTNKYCNNYLNPTEDIYDINGNSLTDDLIGISTAGLDLISPNALLTSQAASQYDENGSEAVGPQIALVTNDQRTAKIEIAIKNNQADTISEVVILGRIPSTDSEYVINGRSLESDFSTTMTNAGITIPAEIRDYVKIYYSENVDATQDLSDSENGWTETPDFSKVKSYMIVLDEYVMPTDVTHKFSYNVNIPEGINYNDVSYSHHAVFYCLDTLEGKYRTQTEPNKLGIMMTQLYDLELSKYQVGRDILVQGATYAVTEEGTDTTKTKITSSEGKLLIKGLKAEKTYTVKELRSPENYDLNLQEIKFTTAVDGNDLIPTLISGTLREGTQLVSEKLEGENYKIKLQVEDEVLASLSLIKVDKSGNRLENVRFKLTGEGLSSNGVSLSTSSEGIAQISGLKFNEEYTLTETRAVGYYLNDPVKFRINKQNGIVSIDITEGTVLQTNIVDGEFPVAEVTLENERIPSFNLKINKIKSGDDSIKLEDARFQLLKDDKIVGNYVTDANGYFEINNLLVSNDDTVIKYVLKEIKAPDGFVKSKDIEIEVRKDGDDLILLTENNIEYTINGEDVNLTVKDVPTFGLTKVDGTTMEPLPGTKFAIYNVEEEDRPATDANGNIVGTKETINGKEYYVVTTDAAGQITADFQEGLYKAVEVETCNPKYELNGDSYYFGIGASRQADLLRVMTDTYTYGGSDTDLFMDATSTTDGGTVTVGYFSSPTIALDDITITNVGGTDSFIVKRDVYGDVDWAYSFGNASDDRFNKVIELDDKSLIVTGSFTGSITIGDTMLTSNGNTDIMIMRFTENGELSWVKNIGGGSNDSVSVLNRIDGQNYYIAGSFYGTITQNGITITSNNTDGFIFEMNASGTATRGDVFTGTSVVSISDAKKTKDGGYILNGYFRGTINCGADTLTTNGNQSGFLAKLDSDFNPEWGKVFTGDYRVEGGSVTQMGDDGYLVGFDGRENTVTFEGVDHPCDNESNYLIKYDKNGNYEWDKYYQSGGGVPRMITLQDGNSLTFLSHRSSSNVVDGVTLNSRYVIVCHDPDGNMLWYKTPTSGMATGSWITICTLRENKLGEILVSGASATNPTLGITTDGSDDAFLFKIKYIEMPEIELKDYQLLTSTGSDEFDMVISTSDGGYIGAGIFRGTLTIGDKTYTANGSSYGDYIIVKYDEFSRIEWTNTISGSSLENIRAVTETEDGFLFAGNSYNYTTKFGNTNLYRKGNSQDAVFGKFDKNGNCIWTYSFGGTVVPTINDVKATKDGGFVCVGTLAAGGTITINGNTYSSETGNDGLAVKFDAEGNVQWVKVLGGGADDSLSGVDVAPNGAIYAVGTTRSGTFRVDNAVIEPIALTDGWIVKLEESDGTCNWGRNIGGNDSDSFNDIAIDNDGNIYLVGTYRSSIIRVDGIATPSGDIGNSQGVIIKLNSRGKGVWARRFGNETSIGSNYATVSVSKDNGVLVGGTYSYARIASVGNYSLTTRGSNDVVIIKYNGDGEIKYLQDMGSTGADYIYGVDELDNGSIVFAGAYSNTFDFRDTILTSNGSTDGILGRILIREGVEETSELLVENKLKKVKIYTDVQEINGVKGGSISGEDMMPYEEVVYGENNQKIIKMTPNEGYEIVKITVNGEDYSFVPEADGTYTMPAFTEMTDDVEVIVQYAALEGKITINKVDAITGEGLEGATFEITQIEDRQDPENVIGEMVPNGPETSVYVKGTEITDFDSTLTANNANYYFTDLNGSIVPTNGKTYRQSIGLSGGQPSSIADSYVMIDLTGKTGKYMAEVSMTASSEANYDIGFALITTNLNALTNSSVNSAFLTVSGNNVSSTNTSGVLNGGSVYYLRVGYKKDSSGDSYDDQVVINSIKLYGCDETTDTFCMEEIDGEYVSNNKGIDNSNAISYFPIDLTGHTGKYKVSLDVKASSGNYDPGYVFLLETTTTPYNGNQDGRMFRQYGTSNTNWQKVSQVVDGGKVYYLHIGYYKDGSVSGGADEFRVKNIQVTLSNAELYYGELTTNSEGKIMATLPYGTYELKEINAPVGYELDSSIKTIEYRLDGEHEFTIEDHIIPKLTVHHYLRGTTTSVAPDENYEGTIGEDYTTSPIFDLAKYELIKDEEGEYIFPENYKGQYTHEPIVVTYYYDETNCPLIVHHYIRGTNMKVPLIDGSLAEDEEYYGREGDPYVTHEIPEDMLVDYELVKVPNNAEGTYKNELTEVTYYYKKFARTVKITKTDLSGNEKLENAVFEIGKGTSFDNAEEVQEYTTNNKGQISIKLAKGNFVIREKTAPSGYEITEGEKTFTIDNDTTEINIDYTDDLEKGRVIVHHYVAGTTTPITDIDNQPVQAERKSGYIGERFATKPYDNKNPKYQIVGNTKPTYGEYQQEEQEVIYYYALQKSKVTVYHYIEGTTTPVPLPNGDDAPTQEMEGNIGEDYTTSPVTPDNRYGLVAVPQNATGTYAENDTTVIYYYKLKDTSVLVHHFIEGTTTKVPKQGGGVVEDVTIGGRVGDEYTTSEAADKVSYYELVQEPANKNGTMTVDQIVVTYYYRLKQYPYVVNYLEEESGTVLSTQKQGEAQSWGETVDSQDEIITINGYTYTRADINGDTTKTVLTISENNSNNVINLYYTKRSDLSYTVHYKEKDTNITLHTDKVVPGQTFGDTIQSSSEVIPINGYYYNSVDKETLTIGTGTNEITIFYVKRNDLTYTVNYLEKGSNRVLETAKTVSGKTFGESIEAALEIITITGYDYDSLNVNGDSSLDTLVISTEDNIINIFYTRRNNLSYTVNYLEKGSNQVLHTSKTLGGMTYGDVVEAEQEKIAIDGYKFDSLNVNGDFNEDELVIGVNENVINIYYTKRNDLSYIVHYKEKDTNITLHDDKTEGGKTFGETIQSSTEVIAITGYNYDSVDKDTLTITTGTNEITIYYTKKNDLSYIVNYLEKDTNISLHESKLQGGMTYEDKVRAEDEIIAINGYNYDSVDKDELTIGVETELNVINIYYTKVTGLAYTVNYLDKDTLESISTPKTQDGMTFGDEVNSSDEVIDIDGYNYDSVDKAKLTISTNNNENVINIYYTKKNDLSYTVHYKEKGTNITLHGDKTEGGKTFGDVITSSNEVIPINGYNYDSVDKATLTIGTGTNEITVFYVKRNDLSYTVHYKEKGTNRELHTDKTEGGKTFGDVITSSTEIIDIDGYNYDSVDKATLTIGTENNEITIYYTKRNDLKYRVKYLEKGTNRELETEKEQDGMTFGDVIQSSSEIIEIDGYNYDSVDKESLTITTNEDTNEIIIYYTKRNDLSYTVHYKEKGTNITLHDDKTEGGKTFGDVIQSSSEVISINGYNYDSVDKESLTIGTGANEITVYYVKRSDLSYTVNYLEKGTNRVIHEQKLQTGVTYLDEITGLNEVVSINGYNYDSLNINGDGSKDTLIIGTTISENVINIYYTKVTGITYTVNYLEKDTEEVLHPAKVSSDKTFEEEVIGADERIVIDGYNYDSLNINGDGSKDTLIIGTNPDENVINIYYTKRNDLSYTVYYKEKGTNNGLKNPKTEGGKTFGDVIQSSTEVIAIDGYNYDSVDKDSLTITTGTNEITIWYTKRNDLSYIVHYKEKDTNITLHDDKTEGGKTFGDVIQSSSEVIPIDGYNYDSVDKNTLTITTGTNEITVFYVKRNDLSYIVHYVDKDTGESLHEDKTVTGKTFGDTVQSSSEVIPIDGYNYDSVDKDILTITTGTNEITIFYVKRNNLSYTVHYKEKDTNETLHDDKQVPNQTFGDTIQSSTEVIAISGYNYDSVDKATLTITTGTNEITIWYTKRNDLSYTVNYLEKGTNEEIHDPKLQGEMTYLDTVRAIDEVIAITGYDYDSCDKDSITIQVDSTRNVINLYYTRVNGLAYTVNYLDKDTNEPIHEPKVDDNKTFGDVIQSSSEIIPIDGYNYDSVDKASLTISTNNNENVINIYYTKRNDLSYIVHYKEKGTNEELHTDKTQGGKTFGDVIQSSSEVIPIDGYNYDSVDKATLTIGTGTNEITIFYVKRNDLSYTVHYKEKGTNETLHSDKQVPDQTFGDIINSADEIIEINGYNYDSVDKNNLVITTGTNEITIFYVKKNDLSYTVHYKEIGTSNTLHEDKTVTGKTFGDVIQSSSEVIPINGHNFSYADKETLTIGTGTNEITLWYGKRTDLSYTVHYKELGTNEELHEDKVVGNQVYDTVINSADEVITINGYNYNSADKDTLTIGTGTNEITIFYTKRQDLPYRVKYLEKDTNRPVHEEKIVDDAEYDETIISRDEIITIPGYDFDSYDKEFITITTNPDDNIITIFYTKKNGLSYTVNYLEKGTGRVIHDPKQQSGKTFEDVVQGADEIITIPAYNYDSFDINGDNTKQELVISDNEAENVINIFYTRKPAKVIVHYYEEGTTNKVSDDVEKNGLVNDPYETEEATNIPSKYELVAQPTNKNGVYTEDDIEVIYYYRKKATKVIVHHLEDPAENGGLYVVLAEDEEKTGRVDDPYTTSPSNSVPSKYEVVTTKLPTNATGNMTEEIIEVTYLYRVKDADLIIKYVDRDTGEEISERGHQEGRVDERYTTDSKPVEGFTLVGDSGNTEGTLTEETITVTYYYAKNTKVTIKYIDEATGEEIRNDDGSDSTEVVNGKVGDEYTSIAKRFYGYAISRVPDDANGTMTREEKTIYYYYNKMESGIIVNYIALVYRDGEQQEEILESYTQNGLVGEDYSTSPRTYANYDLVEERLPANATGRYREEVQEINYYYLQKAEVIVKYIDKYTGEEIPNPDGTSSREVIPGHEGDPYTSERKIFEDYVLEVVPANADGHMPGGTTEVIYVYKHISGGVVENHINKLTGEQLVDEVKHEGYVGEDYETAPKDFANFDLVEEEYPSNATGKFRVEEQFITYYYLQKASVTVRYIDSETNRDIPNDDGTDSKEEKTGHVGDSYTSEVKPFNGYILEQVPDNATGEMTEDPITVVYRYRKIKFNLKVEKIIKSITVNGIEEEINGDLAKAEVYRKEVKGQTIKVKYIIRVTNDSELEGSAVIRELIPEGMKMDANQNPDWTVSGGFATLDTGIIVPGDTRAYGVVLDWEQNGDNIGTKTNNARIITTDNKYGFEETDITDNADTADLIIAVSTGDINYAYGAIGLLAIISGIAITFIKLDDKKRKAK